MQIKEFKHALQESSHILKKHLETGVWIAAYADKISSKKRLKVTLIFKKEKNHVLVFAFSPRYMALWK